jgi:hypothetical protein
LLPTTSPAGPVSPTDGLAAAVISPSETPTGAKVGDSVETSAEPVLAVGAGALALLTIGAVWLIWSRRRRVA